MTADVSSPVTHVFRLLTRRRTAGEYLPSSTFAATFAQRRAQRFTGLFEVDLPGGARGYLLLHHGRLVHAVYGSLAPTEAARTILHSARHGTVHVFALGDDSAALALASVDGRVVTLAQPMPAHEPTLLTDLGARGFEGVVLLERGATHHHIWHLSGGASPRAALPDSTAGYRKTVLAWAPRPLPALLYADESPAPDPVVAPVVDALPPRPVTAEELWRAFERELHEELDERAPRLLALLRDQHASTEPGELRQVLAEHLRRVAGSASRQDPSTLLSHGAPRAESE
ncbi:hypothetical protein [Deinococcus planocerae]|uniref:hypothetical protein n=1 Tax=Deinococcus planocerae TaxID=1737569 RepID=UPI000C7F2F68|nr:hypothetical protein [Deinococcus planocerae]